MNAPSKLDLAVPPAALWLAAGLLMKLLAGYGPKWAWLQQREAAVGLIASGFLIAVLGVVIFRRRNTTVDPRFPHKSSALVTGGVYRFTRNPMYLGMLLALIGWGWWLGALWSFAVPPLFVWYLNHWQIGPEEQALERLFPSEFTAYRRSVRRWI